MISCYLTLTHNGNQALLFGAKYYDEVQYWTTAHTEAATRGVLCKKVFLEFSQNSQENTYAIVFFKNKVAGLRPATLLKKETLAQVFSCKFC